MAELARNLETTIVRPLPILVPLIKEELALGHQAGVEHYRRAGEMLLEAKTQVAKGQWQSWLKRNFSLSYETAINYMKLAERSRADGKTGRGPGPFSTLAEAARPSGKLHAPVWTQPVREVVARVNIDVLAQERQNRAKEQQLIRALAYKLIDIGYKVLVTQLHPDKGGSNEAMARLNRVRNILKSAV